MNKLCKAICSLIFLLVCASLNITCYAQSDTEIVIIPFDYNILIDGTPEEIERTLYPSGILLPTKYFDLLDLQNLSGITFDDVGSCFLRSLFPDKIEFTYPEYRAALEFIWLFKITTLNEGETTLGKAINALESFSDWSLSNNISNAVLSSSIELNELALKYKDLLNPSEPAAYIVENHTDYKEILSVTDGGFLYTFGSDMIYSDATATTDAASIQIFPGYKYSDALLSRTAYWEKLGVVFKDTRDTITTRDSYIIYDSKDFGKIDVKWIEISDATSMVEGTLPDKTTETFEPIKEEDSDVQSPTPTREITSEDMFKEDTEKRDNSAIQKVSSNTQGNQFIYGTSDVVKRHYGFRDIITILCLVFVTISVIVLWVIHTVKQRRDPLRKWLK